MIVSRLAEKSSKSSEKLKKGPLHPLEIYYKDPSEGSFDVMDAVH